MRVIVLGSGTSHGVPMIGCTCTVCTSTNPKNHRYRPSIAIQHDGRTILVDTTPEMRLQALASGLNRVDAVLITHTHADHIFGLDDLRRFNDLSGEAIPVYAAESDQDDIRRIFRYIFVETQVGGGKPRIELHPLPDVLELFGLRVEVLTVMHGALPVRAFRIGPFAYVTDTNRIPEEAMAKLRGVDTLILDAVRYEPHVTHYGLWEAVEVAKQLGARHTLFTHLSHKFDHDTANSELPPGMELAYDGQVLDF